MIDQTSYIMVIYRYPVRNYFFCHGAQLIGIFGRRPGFYFEKYLKIYEGCPDTYDI